MSTLSNQAAQGGSRAIIGATQNALEQQRQQEAQIAANLDAQQMQVNQLQFYLNIRTNAQMIFMNLDLHLKKLLQLFQSTLHTVQVQKQTDLQLQQF